MNAWGVNIASERKQRALSKDVVGCRWQQTFIWSCPVIICTGELRWGAQTCPNCVCPRSLGRFSNSWNRIIGIYSVAFETTIKEILWTYHGRSSDITQRCDLPWKILSRSSLEETKVHQGSSMSFQICNIKAPNSVKITCILHSRLVIPSPICVLLLIPIKSRSTG